MRTGLASAAEERDAFLRRCREWMAAQLAEPRPRWRAWVACEADALVGHVWLSLIEKIPNPVAEPERHGYVSNLYVKPEFRGRGTGERLLRQALDWCGGHGVDAVVLWATPGSRSLYARHGFAGDGALMQLRAPERG